MENALELPRLNGAAPEFETKTTHGTRCRI